MILGFKKKFANGQLSNFKEKILEGIKIHTIREDKPKRWRAKRSIQMCYRGKNYSVLDEFNKGLPHLQRCTGVQEIEIKTHGNQKVIIINGRQLGLVEHLLLAKNDGFEDVHDFYRWFSMVEFKGRIIHWTDYRY